ncbi:MAG: polyhydroxyalkanoate depolymerase [Rhizobiaceae bacterium]
MSNPYTWTAYDLAESTRLTSKWLGATAQTFWGQPAFGIFPNPIPAAFAAWGEVTERTLDRMVVRPDWGIHTVVSEGSDHLVDIKILSEKPFGRLLEFSVNRDDKLMDGNIRPRVLLIAPMSGHYATLLRKTVISLLPDCDVFITDWRNARNVPVSAGSFDVEDYAEYVIDFLRILGPQTNVVAVCQPVPLTLVATAWLAQHDPLALPKTLTLIGGPVDPDAAPTEVTDFGRRITMGELEHTVIQNVGSSFAGAGRAVYPGTMQLASFMAMNWDKHSKSFADQILRVMHGDASDFDRHNTFYDEYLAVMDMPAEFYLSTVERIFKKREIAQNQFTLRGNPVDISAITSVPVKVVEGGRDDISAPGQCAAALELMPDLPKSKKAHHIEAEAGHFGIFSGKAWHNNIRPEVLDFIARHAEPEVEVPKGALKKSNKGKRQIPDSLSDSSIAV